MDLINELGPYRAKEIVPNPGGSDFVKLKDGNLSAVENDHLKATNSNISSWLQDIASELNSLFREYKGFCVETDVPKEERVKKMVELTRAIDSQIEDSLTKMFRSSLQSFKVLIKYLTLGLGYYEGFERKLPEPYDVCSVYDLYLSNNIFFLRYKAMDEFGMVPVSMKACIHPNILPCKSMSNLMRRASYISQSVLHISRMINSGFSLIMASTKERSENVLLLETKATISRKTYKSNSCFTSQIWLSKEDES